MTDDPGESAQPSGSERPRREPPTIDLEPSEVGGDTQNKAGARWWWRRERSDTPGQSRLRFWTAGLGALSGALAACVVVLALWASGAAQRFGAAPAEQTARPASAAVGDLAARLQRLEARPQTSSMVDAQTERRIGDLQTMLGNLRDEVGAQRKQLDGLAAELNALQTAPHEAAAGSTDSAELAQRLSRLEQNIAALSGQLRSVSTSAGSGDRSTARLALFAMLEERARRGAPFTDLLAAEKKLADDQSQLAPLEPFAAGGIPTDAALCRELLALLPGLVPSNASAAPQPQQPATTSAGAGLIGRLMASSTKLVKIERADAPQNAAPSLATVEDAARRNDVTGAQSELAKQPDDVRIAAQHWTESVEARDKALARLAALSAQAVGAIGTSQ